MHPEATLLLNLSAAENRVRELALKRWWVADQMGVDRKTVGRWLNGRVKRIRRANLERLAEVLECSAEELTLSSEAEAIASVADQERAAQLIEQENLLEVLSPSGRWPLLESLIKATLRPSLPLPLLGKLYNLLAIACWRQSRIDDAETYAEKAMQMAVRTGNLNVLTGAHLNLGTISWCRGQLDSASAHYRACLARQAHFASSTNHAAAYSNLGAVCCDIGELDRSEVLQLEAIRRYGRLEKPMNSSIARCQLGLLRLQQNRLREAKRLFARSIADAERVGYERGILFGSLAMADLNARQGRHTLASADYERGIVGFEELGIREALNYEIGSRVARLGGDLELAAERLRQGFECAVGFPLAEARLHVEAMLGAVARRETDSESKHREKAISLLDRLGAHPRAAALKLGR